MPYECIQWNLSYPDDLTGQVVALDRWISVYKLTLRGLLRGDLFIQVAAKTGSAMIRSVSVS